MPASFRRPAPLPNLPFLPVVAMLAVAALGSPAWASSTKTTATAPGPGASVAGSVLDPDGAAVPGATVTVSTPAGLAASTRTDAAGRFEVGNLVPGTYEVRVAYPGLATDPATVHLGEGERQDLTLRARLRAVTDTVIVTAGHVETPLASTPSPVTVFREQDIEARQFESAADLLRLTPGVAVAQSGGRGALASVFPRGGESDYTLVLVDGIRVNSMGGGFDFAWLPVSDVERVEVVRGPQSAVYGADAIGGVVHVITRRGGPARVSGLIEGGSLATTRAAAAFAGSRGAWSWGGGAEHAASDGVEGLTSRGERVTNDDGESNVAGMNLRFSLPALTLGGHARLARTERGFPGPYGRDPNGTFAGIDRISRGWNDQKTAGLDTIATFSPRVRARGSISYADLEGRFASPFGSSFSETQRVDARVQADLVASDALSFTAGTEVLGERGRSTYITGLSLELLPVRRRIVGAFVEGRAELGGRLSASAGLRVERIQRLALEEGNSPGAERLAFGTDVVVSANPRASVSWFLRPPVAGAWSWTRLRVNAGTGIRPPDAFEIAFTDNPSLAPERSRSYDAGIEQALLDGRAVFDLTWFDNRYDDLIVAVGRAYQDASRYSTDNIANARARGLEWGLALQPRTWLSVRAAYTFLDTEILAVDGGSGQAPSPFAPGDALIRRPRHQGWIEAVAAHRRASVFARFGARGRVLDVDPSFGAFGGKLDAPGYGVADVGGSVTVWRSIAVFGRVTNLFDEQYEEALGFPSPGRAFVGGLRVAASR